MLSGCKKDEATPDKPDYSQNKGEFKDSRDGKVYKWVKIGTQVWMAQNLAYTGSGIRHITDNNDWQNNSDCDGWCYYKNDENYGNTYGVLYQWEAAKTACPSGWHLPSDDEWKQLEDYLIENGYSYDGVIGHSHIGKSLAADNGWFASNQEGAVGNSDFPEIRNKTGFSALPGGDRHDFGEFWYLGYDGYWWSSSARKSYDAYCRIMDYDSGELSRSSDYRLKGFSVRCVKD